jgi:hypothetical protein
MKLLYLIFIKASYLVLMMGIAVASAGELPPLKTVFVLAMENHHWNEIKDSPSAPFLNSVVLPMAAHCEQYYTPPVLRPSLPNYLWLVAGTNFGISDNRDPAFNHQNTTNHLVHQLRNAGISWRSYQEDISGTHVPLTATNRYVPKHNPFVYFDDITGTNSPTDAYGIAHIRPFTELAGDLASNNVARYNFVTPNLCNDMHDSCPPLYDRIRQGDQWLAAIVPQILQSQAYADNGALFILWDEGNEDPEGTAIGMILLSPLAKGGGYASTNRYTHSSVLRTWQEIFGVGPLLGDAAEAENLSDLFLMIKLTGAVEAATGAMALTALGVQPGRTYIFEASSNLFDWLPISTNEATSNQVSVTDYPVATFNLHLYRVRQLP